MAGKILIIDDEPDLLKLMKMLLERDNYKVVTADKAENGLRKIKNEKPDLVILDVLLPGESGYQLLHKIRSQKDSVKDTPVIVISGRGKMKNLFESREINDFIDKPFDAQTLLSKVKKILPPPKVVQEKKGATKKALIIGNEDSAVGLIQAFLESHNFSIVIVPDGPKGIKEVSEIQPDLILVQSVMKEMDGIKVCRILRKRLSTEKTPFIIFSGQPPGFMLDESLDNVEIANYSQPKNLIKKIDQCLKKNF